MLGHSKRMQVMRKEWINEAKSKNHVASGPTHRTQTSVVEVPGSHTQESSSKNIATLDRSKTPIANDIDDELYSATPRKILENRHNGPRQDIDESLFVSDVEDDTSPPGDELDALLAEEDNQDKANASESYIKPHFPIANQEIEPCFDDEMEAMADMDGTWQQISS